MKENDIIIDIHSHTSLRAINTASPNDEAPDLWSKNENLVPQTSVGRWVQMQTKGIAKHSQSNMEALATGKVRVLFDSLYPVEKGFLNIRKLPNFLVGKKSEREMMQVVTGYNADQLRRLKKDDNYFAELNRYYRHLQSGQGLNKSLDFGYQLASDFRDVEHILGKDDKHIAVVITIEGGHVFGTGTQATAKMDVKKLKTMTADNIAIVKTWEHPPFFINLAHHFWNQLCGHARSFKPPIQNLLNQSVGLNRDITDLGWHVITELLSRKNGRRVLIDIKHMSVAARKSYYHFVKQYNRIHPEDPIPIICSHTGVNGFKTMDASLKKNDRAVKSKNNYFHAWSINLADDELRFIQGTGGLIGVMVDKGMLGGIQTVANIDLLENPTARRNAYTKLILDNIFHIVKTIGKKSAWDIIALGTDFDGIITHIDHYADSSTLPDLRKDLIEYMKKYQYGRAWWYGYTPEEMIAKMMSKNTLEFLRKHF